MEQVKPGCAAPAVVRGGGTDQETRPEGSAPTDEEKRMSVMVGHEAPDFEATGYHKGDWGKFKLSDYRDKWVVLCFYPGDFTFV